MNWKQNTDYWFPCDKKKFLIEWPDHPEWDDVVWQPHLSHDHVQLSVDECFKRGLGRQYIKHLCDGCGVRNLGILDFGNAAALSIALPETKAFAALAALTGK
jgi:hypothetical protein